MLAEAPAVYEQFYDLSKKVRDSIEFTSAIVNTLDDAEVKANEKGQIENIREDVER